MFDLFCESQMSTQTTVMLDLEKTLMIQGFDDKWISLNIYDFSLSKTWIWEDENTRLGPN